MTSGAPRRSEWMPMSMHSRQGTLSLLQRNKSAMTKPHIGILTLRQNQTHQAPPTHHVSFKLQSQVEMSQLSLDSSLQSSLVSKPHHNISRDSSLKGDLSERQSNPKSQELIRKQSIGRMSSFGSDAGRNTPSIPHGRLSTLTAANHTVSGSPKSLPRKKVTRNGQGALQRAKQQAMQTPFKPTGIYKGKENCSGLLSQGSLGGKSSFSGSLFPKNQSFGQPSLPSNAGGKLSSASVGTRSVVTHEPEHFAATKASLNFEFQRFMEEKEIFLKKKEEEMLNSITRHARELTKGLATTVEQGKSDIMAEAKHKHFQPDLRSEYLAQHQAKMNEAREQINLDMHRAKKEAIEDIRFEHSSILNSLEMEKKYLLDTGREIIAQVIQAKDAALHSINKLQSGTVRSLTDYLTSITIGKKDVPPTRDDFSLTIVATPRKKRLPYSKPASPEKGQSQDSETCNSLESTLEIRMSEDLMKKRRRTNITKSKDTRKKPLRERSAAPDIDATSNLSENARKSEPRCSDFKVISPSSTAVKNRVPLVSTRKQKRFPRHFQGRSKRARTHTCSSQLLDFKDDVTFSFRGK